MSNQYQQYQDKMQKTVDVLKNEFTTIRTGRPSAAVLNKVNVDYYGVPTPIQQVGTISSPDAHSLMIQPYDSSVLKAVEKAILASDVGITPQNDGKAIRLTFPPLTEERRKELTKLVAKYAEEAKVAIRNVRRDAMDDFKAQKKASEMTEDDYKLAEKEIQKAPRKRKNCWRSDPAARAATPEPGALLRPVSLQRKTQGKCGKRQMEEVWLA